VSKKYACEMVTGHLVTEDGDPGREVACGRSPIFARHSSGFGVCEECHRGLVGEGEAGNFELLGDGERLYGFFRVRNMGPATHDLGREFTMTWHVDDRDDRLVSLEGSQGSGTVRVSRRDGDGVESSLLGSLDAEAVYGSVEDQLVVLGKASSNPGSRETALRIERERSEGGGRGG